MLRAINYRWCMFGLDKIKSIGFVQNLSVFSCSGCNVLCYLMVIRLLQNASSALFVATELNDLLMHVRSGIVCCNESLQLVFSVPQ